MTTTRERSTRSSASQRCRNISSPSKPAGSRSCFHRQVRRLMHSPVPGPAKRAMRYSWILTAL
eukprot:2915142-Prymnesium_polylepis.1